MNWSVYCTIQFTNTFALSHVITNWHTCMRWDVYEYENALLSNMEYSCYCGISVLWFSNVNQILRLLYIEDYSYVMRALESMGNVM